MKITKEIQDTINGIAQYYNKEFKCKLQNLIGEVTLECNDNEGESISTYIQHQLHIIEKAPMLIVEVYECRYSINCDGDLLDEIFLEQYEINKKGQIL